MTATVADPLLDALVRDFGGNYVFALDLLEQYRSDPAAIDASWREYFDRLLAGGEIGDGGGRQPVGEGPAFPRSIEPEGPLSSARLATQEPGSSRTETASATQEPVSSRTESAGQPRAVVVQGGAPAPGVAAPVRSRGLIVPAILPGDIAQPIRGGSLKIVENMEASLTVPTATSIRTVPVRTLEENRQVLNKHRAAAGAGKVSFTHLVAWAILRALDAFPRLNDAYAELESGASRVIRDQVRLGLAVDVQKKDGTRTLLVPNIKGAGTLDFAQFLAAYDGLVAKARKSALMPDDFMGTTISLTNPGVVGTTSSAPRLMPGQGVIVATGALDYPAEYRSMSPRTLSLLGISKVMTITSTYDHRIIQGAESGLFLARIEELLRGDDGFYERIFKDLGVPQMPIRWEIDAVPGLAVAGGASSDESVQKQARVLQLINAYRVRGHLVADLDPLDSRRAPHPDLEPSTYGLTLWDLDREFFTNGALGKERASLREILDVLRDTYCGAIGAEYMFIADHERKAWIQQRIEKARNRAAFTPLEKKRILEKVVEAEAFEKFLHAKYVGHKRFSLEGCEALIPLLDRLLTDAATAGVREAVIGMAHRGRLNVLANTIGKPLAQIFSEFEGNVDPDATQGSGDVKYHLGASGTHDTPAGVSLGVTLAPNPSHLEFVNPVVEGIVRARQDSLHDLKRQAVMPILLHGDAAFAGQGIVAETLNLSALDGYATGGTIHVVINNQIGFTTLPHDARSSTYCTDVAKMVQAPVFHVNGDDPEAVVYVAALAVEYRRTFGTDLVIDMVGYRRWGHNEADEPAYTQPLMYARIKAHSSVAQLYGPALVRSGVVAQAELDALWADKKAQMQREGETGAFAHIHRRAPVQPLAVDPGAMRARLRSALAALSSVPQGFELHPKLQPFLKKRAELLEGRGEVDWATGEALAFGTLLLEGIPVRLSGQDSGRGTFSQRHAVLYDITSGKEHVPLNALAPSGTRFEVHDSLLSEAAVMGFEFGYAVAEHRALVMWEAQFGDFWNGAQVIVDQFVVASEAKWGQPTGLVLLLPHGHEGQGPEHSSARIERFLTLSADDNMRVCYPSTPASYFHLLRWQGRDAIEKPMVIFTPKSLLRLPACTSSLADLADGVFRAVLDDTRVDPGRVSRVVLTSGKLYFDLAKARDERHAGHVALVRLEQYYPFPAAELLAALARYAPTAELAWAQEEPRNMGAWRFLRDQFLDGVIADPDRRVPRYIGRGASAAPAPGSHKVHQQEQDALIAAALA